MTDWESPEELARDSVVYANLMHVVLGLYAWEFFTSLDFDWQFITGSRIDCRAVFVFNQLAANAAAGLASINLALRTTAALAHNKWATGGLILLLFGHCAVLLLGTLLQARGLAGGACVAGDSDAGCGCAAGDAGGGCAAGAGDAGCACAPGAGNAGCGCAAGDAHRGVLAVMVVYGLIYFLAALAANLLAAVFLLVHANAVVAAVAAVRASPAGFVVPAVVGASIAACRAVRQTNVPSCPSCRVLRRVGIVFFAALGVVFFAALGVVFFDASSATSFAASPVSLPASPVSLPASPVSLPASPPSTSQLTSTLRSRQHAPRAPVVGRSGVRVQGAAAVGEGSVTVVEGAAAVGEGSVTVGEGSVTVVEGSVTVVEGSVTVVEGAAAVMETVARGDGDPSGKLALDPRGSLALSAHGKLALDAPSTESDIGHVRFVGGRAARGAGSPERAARVGSPERAARVGSSERAARGVGGPTRAARGVGSPERAARGVGSPDGLDENVGATGAQLSEHRYGMDEKGVGLGGQDGA
ncbi:hypothetical protein HDZ31DRAFT_62597 [Schizophyllum fasciatum]